jgi:decaprenylphospho-beta-D-ribofuranose 2-oxidase
MTARQSRVMKFSGWGRYPVIESRVHAPRDERTLRDLVTSQQSVIARGNGRAYGDSAINPTATIDMRRFNRMLAFDPRSGQLTTEAGVILEDIIGAFLPRGWFPAVTPGTRFVSLGGMIAADVHGKNHHKDGSFRQFVDWIDVMGADGAINRCSRDTNAQLFDYTLGGMGLTGVILRAAFRLRPVETGWIRQTTIPAPNLQAAMEVFEQSGESTYSVAWIDCLGTGGSLGRSLVILGEHAKVSDLSSKLARDPLQVSAKRKASIPVDFPAFVLNRHTVGLFNNLYYRLGAYGSTRRLIDWDSYFYPLDAILRWNRIYGRNGFAQFQCVLPLNQAERGLTSLLEAIAAAGTESFLAVLKRFGPQDSGFAFPMVNQKSRAESTRNCMSLAP